MLIIGHMNGFILMSAFPRKADIDVDNT